MGISVEQAAHWPKSRALADAIEVRAAVVYDSPDGLRATIVYGGEDEADALAVRYQRQGWRAWVIELEGDGALVTPALPDGLG